MSPFEQDVHEVFSTNFPIKVTEEIRASGSSNTYVEIQQIDAFPDVYVSFFRTNLPVYSIAVDGPKKEICFTVSTIEEAKRLLSMFVEL